jgi:radical SAM superfamily enzyme YgiQ (UPF0313 family)
LLATKLTQGGHYVEAVDLDGLDERENFVLQSLDKVDAVGLSVMAVQAEGARRLIALIRYHYPEMRIVCGGHDVTNFPQKYLDWGADVAATGECDGNVCDIFERGEGIVAGQQGDIGGRPLWEQHAPKPWQYPGHPHAKVLPEALCMTSRGCPYGCTFCSNPYKLQRIRYREVADVQAELLWLEAQGVKGVFLYDDEAVDRLHIARISGIMAGAHLQYRAMGRCNFSPEYEDSLIQAHHNGLYRVMWGVESFDPTVLKRVNKGVTQEQILTTLRLSRKAGLDNFLFLMAGMPGEDQASADLNYEALRTLIDAGLVQDFQVTPCEPAYGTALYEEAQRDGWYGTYDPHSWDVLSGTPWLSQGRLAEHVGRMRMLTNAIPRF